MSDDKEVLDRLRRIETRLTRYLQAQGFDAQTSKPVWGGGVIALPSPHASLKSILSVIPDDWGGRVSLMLGEEFVAYLEVQ